MGHFHSQVAVPQSASVSLVWDLPPKKDGETGLAPQSYQGTPAKGQEGQAGRCCLGQV